MSRLLRRLVAQRPTTMAGKVLLFAVGLVAAAAGAAFAYLLVAVVYGGGNYALAQASTLSAPTAATASEASATSVTIGWTNPGTQVAGAKYKVTQSPGTVVVCHTVSGPTCTATGLSPATTYTFSVVATLGTNWHSTATTTSFKTLGVTTTSLPNGTVGVSYSTTLAAVGGTGAYTWSLASGTLPSWASLTPANGKITGTPTSAGTTTGLEFKVTDSKSFSATSGTLSLTVVTTTPVFTIEVTGGSSATITYGSQATLSETGLPPTGTGTLTFKTSATATLCSVALTVATHCQTPATLAAGSYNGIKATYSGTGGYHSASSSNTVSLTVNKASESTSTTLTLNHATRTYGSEATETFTATVTGQTGDGYPEGTVSIKTGSTTEATATFTSGTGKTATYKVTLTASQLAAGSYSLKATFNPTATTSSSSPNYTYTTSSSTPAQSFTVNKATESTSTTLTLNHATRTYGSEATETFTATVTGQTGDGYPEGTVSIKTGSTTEATATFTSGTGKTATYKVTLTASQLAAGSYSLKATFNPTATTSSSSPNYTYTTSSSTPAQSFTVNKASESTSTTLTLNHATRTYGSEATETFTATVTGQTGDGYPEGTVSIKTGSTTEATATFTSGTGKTATYKVTLTASQLAAGSYSLKATFNPTATTSSSSPNYTYTTSSSTPAQSFTVNKATESTSTTLTLNHATRTYGSEATETFTATVTGQTGDGYPEGTVSIKTGSTTEATATFTSGTGKTATYKVTLTASQLAAGSYSLKATFNPTATTSSSSPNYTYTTSSSTPAQSFTVNKASESTSTTLTLNHATRTYGSEATETFTATVTGQTGDGYPEGTVSIKTGSTTEATATFTSGTGKTATYKVTLTASQLAAGSYSLKATFNPTATTSSSSPNYTYTTSSSTPAQSFTVNKASESTSTTLTLNHATRTYGSEATETFTATVTGQTGDGYPEGTVSIKTGSTTEATATFTSGTGKTATYKVTLTASQLAAGSYSLKATFNPTATTSSSSPNYTYTTSSSTPAQSFTVNKATESTSTSLTLNHATRTYGSEATETFTATVTGQTGDGYPEGTVSIKTGSTTEATATFTSGTGKTATYKVTLTASQLAAGSYSLKATFNPTATTSSSSPNYTYTTSSSTPAQSFTVNKATESTSTTLTLNHATRTYGSEATETFTATVTGQTGDGYPEGTVSIKTGSTTEATATFTSGTGKTATYKVTLTASQLAAGSYSLKATFNPTATTSSSSPNYTYTTSSSTPAQSFTVNKASESTSTTLTLNHATRTYGSEATETFTATVTGQTGDGYPEGTVSIKTGSTTEATATFTSGTGKTATYKVTLTASQLAAGSYSLKATFNPTATTSSSSPNYTYTTSSSTPAQSFTVNKATESTSTTLTLNHATRTYGSEATETFTATVTGQTGDGYPEGTVSIKTGSTTEATATFTSGTGKTATYKVTLTASQLAAGSYSLKATFNPTATTSSSSPNYTYTTSSSTPAQSFTVNKATESTSTSLTLNHATRTYGSEATETFTATVTGQTGDGYPEGTVSIKTGSTTEATATFTSGTGKTATYKVTLTASQLAAGSYSLKATFNPTATTSSSSPNYTYTTSSSTPAQSFTVNKASESTSTTLTLNHATRTYGSEATETFTATVTGQTGDGYPEGTVSIKTGSTTEATATFTSGTGKTATYKVTLTASQLAAGSYSLKATFNPTATTSSSSPNYTYTTSSSTPAQSFTVNKASESTSTTLTLNHATRTYGSEATETFTATVTGQTGDGYPEGTVSIKTGSTTEATATFTSGTGKTATYKVTLTASQLAAGSYSLKATFNPTATTSSSSPNYTYTTSSSTPAQSFTVNKASTSFTVATNHASIAYGAKASLSESGLQSGATGTVAFKAGATTLCTATLPTTSCTTSVTQSPGFYSPITGVYTAAGTSSYAGSTSTNSISLTISSPSSSGANLNAVAALTTSSAWAVGTNCSLYYYNGTTWTQDSSGSALTSCITAGTKLNGVAYATSSYAWSVGTAGTILVCTASCNSSSATWTKLTQTSGGTIPASTVTLTSASANATVAAGDAVIVAGYSSTGPQIWGCSATCNSHLAGTSHATWTNVTPSSGLTSTEKLNGVSIGDTGNATHSVAVGTNGSTGLVVTCTGGGSNHCDTKSTVWAVVTTPPTHPLNGAFVIDGGHYLAAGNSGTVAYCTKTCQKAAAKWTAETDTAASGVTLTGVSSSALGHGGKEPTVVAGHGGFIEYCAATCAAGSPTWTSETSHTTSQLNGVSAVGSTVAVTFAVAVGNTGTIVTSANGSTWSATTVAPTYPKITTANTASFVESTSNTFTVTATGLPAPTLSESGTLPGGVTFTASTGVLSGTPTATGTFPITFKAHNSTGTFIQSFTLTVYAANGSGTMSVSPTTFTASQTGVTLTFTYTAATGGMNDGKITVTVPSGWTTPSATNTTATGGTGTDTLSFSSQTITISNVTLAGGAKLTITYGITGHTVTVGSTAGVLTLTTKQASLSSGTPVALTSGSPTVNVSGPPAITSASSTSFNHGTAGSFTVTTTGYPTPTLSDTSWLVGTHSPACTKTTATGLSLTTNSNGTATIKTTSSTPAGTDTVCIEATNSAGTAYQIFTLTVATGPSVVGVGAKTVWTADNTTKNVAYPSGLASGDLLVLMMGHSHQDLATCPTSWTPKNATVHTTTGTHAQEMVCYRIWTGSASSVTVKDSAGTPNGPYIAEIAAFAHVTATTPFDVTSVTSSGSKDSSTFTPTGLTTSTASDLVVSFVDQDDATTSAPPTISLTSSHTQGFSLGSSVGATDGPHQGDGLAYAYKTVSTAGVVAAPTWVSNKIAGGSIWVGITFALKP